MLSTKLQTVLAVAEHKNFTRAAEMLSMTQPAVSHHIKQLEQEVGAPLFLRSKTGLLLTPQGEIVVSYARRMKALNERMLAELQTAVPAAQRIGTVEAYRGGKRIFLR